MRLFISLFALATTASAGTITYNAALGTLPTAQGFTLNDSTPGPAPSVAGGRLNQGPTPGSGFQFWYQSGLGLNFAAGQSAELTGSFRVLDSSILQAGPGAGFRTGWSVSVADILGNTFTLNLANGLAILSGEYDATLGSSLSAICDCFQFHNFRVLAGNGTARLWIDGLDQGSVTLLLNASSLSPYIDGVWFGDGTNFAGNWSQVQSITVSTVVPEPATAGLMALAGLGALVLRKRRG